MWGRTDAAPAHTGFIPVCLRSGVWGGSGTTHATARRSFHGRNGRGRHRGPQPLSGEKQDGRVCNRRRRLYGNTQGRTHHSVRVLPKPTPAGPQASPTENFPDTSLDGRATRVLGLTGCAEQLSGPPGSSEGLCTAGRFWHSLLCLNTRSSTPTVQKLVSTNSADDTSNTHSHMCSCVSREFSSHRLRETSVSHADWFGKGPGDPNFWQAPGQQAVKNSASALAAGRAPPWALGGSRTAFVEPGA